MAKENVNQVDTAAQLHADRVKLAMDANFEVFQLARAARKMVAGANIIWEEDRAVRGMLTRIAELSDLVYEAVFTDENNKIKSIR